MEFYERRLYWWGRFWTFGACRWILFHSHGSSHTGGSLDEVKGMMKGDVCIGRGSGQRGERSKKSEERLRTDRVLYDYRWAVSGCRLVCQCTSKQDCHAIALIPEFTRSFLIACDRCAAGAKPPSSSVLNDFAQLERNQTATTPLRS